MIDGTSLRSDVCRCDCIDCTTRDPHVIHTPAAIAALRAERDRLDPRLTAELVPMTESEKRALWGDR